eukprot:CAMPEP_0182419864 /NCGR_PEP_ID=MMETSP1167-20130531/4218_1 /TAXON_ID=2988 /ORGANISM="Mallomonas Sp, Strain CCMP3275" /LENGTH=55 /DNA_ID=CAMNT_0024595003 /DNA_START=154 /DNA_END=321 /DNA_ORIENTATION=+
MEIIYISIIAFLLMIFIPSLLLLGGAPKRDKDGNMIDERALQQKLARDAKMNKGI